MSYSNDSGLEQPTYKVLAKLNDHVEIRKYDASKWVTASAACSPQEFASERNGTFYKLFNYISGRNDAAKEISMTVPVVMNYNSMNPSHPVDHTTKCAVTMGFYVPKAIQSTTPKPFEEQVCVKSEPEMIVAVARFGGFASLSDYFHHRDELIRLLGSEAQNYDCVNMMTAGYNSPRTQTNRTNEVWLRKIR
jgi:hypothetical protein